MTDSALPEKYQIHFRPDMDQIEVRPCAARPSSAIRAELLANLRPGSALQWLRQRNRYWHNAKLRPCSRQAFFAEMRSQLARPGRNVILLNAVIEQHPYWPSKSSFSRVRVGSKQKNTRGMKLLNRWIPGRNLRVSEVRIRASEDEPFVSWVVQGRAKDSKKTETRVLVVRFEAEEPLRLLSGTSPSLLGALSTQKF